MAGSPMRGVKILSRSPSSALLLFLFGGRVSLTKIVYRKKGTLILSCLLEDLALLGDSLVVLASL